MGVARRIDWPSRNVFDPWSTHTRVRVTFHSDDGDAVIESGVESDFGKLVGLRTEKTFGNAAGSFTLTMKKALDADPMDFWPDPEGTWVSIQFVCDGNVIDTMFGSIDTIGEDTSRSGEGARSETYQIHGRDHGKVLEETEIFVNIFAPDVVRSALGLYDAVHMNLQGPPDTFIRMLLETWVGNNGMAEQQWELPISLGAGSFYEMLDRSRIERMGPGHGETFDNTLMSPDQEARSVWDAMQEYSNGVMNELYTDLAPRRSAPRDYTQLVPAMFLRERPFITQESRTAWNGLQRWRLRREDIQKRGITKGNSASRFNYWMLDVDGFTGAEMGLQYYLQAAFGAEPLRPGSVPIINEPSVRKHGVRRWRQGTKYLPLSDETRIQHFIALGANWLKRIHDWYSPGPMFRTGTIRTTRVMPEIRIGHRVSEERGNRVITYYCEGVVNEWSYPGAGSTTVTLTRGQFEDEDLLARVYADYELPRMRRAQDQCLIDPNTELDETIAALARGCAFQAPTGNVEDYTFDETLDPATTVEDPARGLVAEGATPEEAAPSLRDGAAAEADLLAEGEAAPSEGSADEALDQEALERGDDIFTPVDPSTISDDPIGGIEEEAGL